MQKHYCTVIRFTCNALHVSLNGCIQLTSFNITKEILKSKGQFSQNFRHIELCKNAAIFKIRQILAIFQTIRFYHIPRPSSTKIISLEVMTLYGLMLGWVDSQ